MRGLDCLSGEEVKEKEPPAPTRASHAGALLVLHFLVGLRGHPGSPAILPQPGLEPETQSTQSWGEAGARRKESGSSGDAGGLRGGEGPVRLCPGQCGGD